MLSNKGQNQQPDQLRLSDKEKNTLNLAITKWVKISQNKVINSSYILTKIEQFYELKNRRKIPIIMEDDLLNYGEKLTYILANDEELIRMINLQLEHIQLNKFSSSEFQIFISELAYSLSENLTVLVYDIWEILNKSSLVYELKNNLKYQLNPGKFKEIFTIIKKSQLSQESEEFQNYLINTLVNNLATKYPDVFATLGQKGDNLLLQKIREFSYKKNIIFNYYQLGCLLDFCVTSLGCDRPNYQLEQFLLTNCQLMTIVDNQCLVLVKKEGRNYQPITIKKSPSTGIKKKIKKNNNKKPNIIAEFLLSVFGFYRFFFNPFISLFNGIINGLKKTDKNQIVTRNNKQTKANYQLNKPVSKTNELNQLIENATEIISLGQSDQDYESSKLLTQLPEKYNSMHPSFWPAKWLLTETNPEIRKLLIQNIGYDRLCQELNAIIIDDWKEYSLFVIHTNPNFEDIYILKMTCPSTKDIQTIRIPPNISSAREAITWANWDINPQNFRSET